MVSEYWLSAKTVDSEEVAVAHPVRLAERAVYKHLHAFPAPLYGNELVNRLPT